MNDYSLIYSRVVSCRNRLVPTKYVVDNLVMCENRVNTHSHRTYFQIILNAKELVKIIFGGFADVFLRPLSTQWCSALRVAAVTALHHYTTALSVGTHRA